MLAGKPAGFTLVEIMIVVVIVGVLAAFAAPRLARQGEVPVLLQGVNAVRTLSVASRLYRLYQNNNASYKGIKPDCSNLDYARLRLGPEFAAPVCGRNARGEDSGGMVLLERLRPDGLGVWYTLYGYPTANIVRCSGVSALFALVGAVIGFMSADLVIPEGEL